MGLGGLQILPGALGTPCSVGHPGRPPFLTRTYGGITDRVGKYALGQLLGQGGFAKVRSGINWDTGERIAAKIMPAKVAQDPQVRSELPSRAAAGVGEGRMR